MSDKITLSPSKETYNAIRADVDVAASFKELIDNAIDNAIRERKETVSVDLEYETTETGKEVVTVRDDSGGIESTELDMLFALGESRKEDIRGSIGAFGIGAKKALMRLGRSFSVVSRHSEASTGLGYTIDESWIEAENEWDVPLEEYEIPAGTTELRITDLNFDWAEKRDSLQETLQRTYQLYLDSESIYATEVNLDLTVAGEPLSVPDQAPFSYTPWGDLYPRRFEGIMISPVDIDSTVELRITVGLMATGDETEAGTDVFCQNRLVVHAARGPNGGFNVPRGLPKFRPESHKRLKIQVEFITDGDAADLPWNADKSRVRSDHPVMREAREWTREIADRYMQARYGDVPTEFHTPYTQESTHAANSGEIAGPFDYRPQFQRLRQGKISAVEIAEKPQANLSQVSKMQETAEAHAKLGIRCESVAWFDEWMLPTYDLLLESAQEDTPFDDLTGVDSEIPDVTDVDVDGLIAEIESAASDHVAAGYRYTDLTPYEQPRYDRALKQHAKERELAIDELTPTSELDPTATNDSPTPSEGNSEGTGQASQPSRSSGGPVSTAPQGGDEKTASDPPGMGTTLDFGPFDEEELEMLERHLGEVSSLSPNERRNALIDYLSSLDNIGINPEALREN